MTIQFRTTQVSAPSTAPSLSIGGTGFYIRHRRVNLDGGVSLWSGATQFSGASATITPEGYGDSSQLLRDEFLYSTDDATYYIIPRTGSQTGAQTVTSFTPGSWAVAVNEDTQDSALTNLNFGTFSSSSSPFQRFYLVNAGLSVGSLTFNFIDAITTEVAANFSGLVQVELEGVFSQYSQAASTTDNDSFIWQAPPNNLNTFGVTFPSNGFAKIKVTLINFPTGGLIENTVSLSMQVQENLRIFPLSYDSGWALNTFLHDPEKGFNFPFISVSNAGLTVTVAPFLVNVNGVAVGRFTSSVFTLSAIGAISLTLSNTGVLQVWETGETIPDNLLTLATLTTIGTGGFISAISYSLGARPQQFGQVDPPITDMFGKFITINASNEAALTDSNPVGIYIGNGYFANGGSVLVATEDTVAIGDRLAVTTGGFATVAGTGTLVARTADYFGFVLCDFLAASTGGGGGTTNLAYTASPTNGIVTSDTGTDATIPATDGTNAGLFLPAEKTKLSGIDLTTKVDLNGNNSEFTFVNFTPSAAPAYQEGRVWYDADTDSISYYDNHTGTSVQVGKELVVTARNNSGAAIANGQAVYISGATGQNPTIALARADSLTTAEIIGVATHDIANNTTGKVTVFGLVNDFDTSAFTDGQQVYLSAATAGLLTATPPASPNFVVFVGYIAHAHVSQGKLLVMSDRAMANDNSLGTSQISFPTQNAVKAYVDAITEGLTIVQTSLATLNPTPGNYYLTTGTTTVNLPAGSNGDVIGIADGASNFGTANCTINPNGAETIAGETAVTLSGDNAYIVLAFWGTRWNIIHGNSFLQPDPPAPTILTTGSGSFVPSSTTRLLRVRVWGATGGSGGVDGVASTIAISGGGGNGGYAEKLITITPGETFTYAVGAKGVGGAAGANNGTAGGTTSFTGSVSGTVQVTGGTGGAGVTGLASSVVGQGVGGIASGGDTNLSGNSSMIARWVSGVIYSYPSNGAPLFGFGRANSSAGAGIASEGIGAGAVGAISTDATNYAGADGWAGQIIVEQYS